MCENTRYSLCPGEATARALSTNTQKIFSSLAGWLLLGTCVHPHSREKMVAQQPQKIQPPVCGGGATEQRALKRLVFGNTSDGLIHHHQKHPI